MFPAQSNCTIVSDSTLFVETSAFITKFNSWTLLHEYHIILEEGKQKGKLVIGEKAERMAVDKTKTGKMLSFYSGIFVFLLHS